MSTDAGFASLAFPSLRDRGRESIEARARVSGHAAGYAAGLKTAALELAERAAALEADAQRTALENARRIEAALAALDTAARALDSRLAPVLLDAQSVLAAASVDIAEAIIGRELATTPDSALSALKRALDHAEADAVVTVRMSPADLASLDEETRAAVAAGVRLQADAAMASGDAVAELPNGYLDARIGAALDRVRAALTEGIS
jgi:flagellar assembly protein FliH